MPVHASLLSPRGICSSLAVCVLAACSPSANTASTATVSAVTSTPSPESSTPSTTEPLADVAAAKIVVQAPWSRGDGIYLLGADGGTDRQLAPDAGSAKHPDWSPDGSSLVFAGDTDGALWTVSVDGSDAKQLLTCDTGCLALDFPAYSPDGRHIAYTRYEPPTAGGPPAGSTIRVLDLDTMTSVDVVRTAQPRLVDVPRWSPNGEELVVGVDVFDAAFNEVGSTIGVVSASGGDIRDLVDPTTYAYAPDWNAKTGEILYSTETIQYRSKAQQGDETWNLWGISSDGSGLRQLTDVPTGQRLWQPTWSPDGDAIVATLETGGADTRRTVLVDPSTGTITPAATTLSTHGRLRPGSS